MRDGPQRLAELADGGIEVAAQLFEIRREGFVQFEIEVAGRQAAQARRQAGRRLLQAASAPQPRRLPEAARGLPRPEGARPRPAAPACACRWQTCAQKFGVTIDKMVKDGTMGKLSKKWFAEDITNPKKF